MKKKYLSTTSGRSISLLFTMILTAGLLYALSNLQVIARMISAKSAPAPDITIKKQPGAPIRISSAKVDTATEHGPRIEIVVSNSIDKTVSAYAIRYDYLYGRKKVTSSFLTSFDSIDAALKPGTSVNDEQGGIEISEPLEKVVLSVDFVEFLDGSVWGPDIYRSAERLAGQRAGAQAAAEYLLKILKERGPNTVMTTLEQENFGPNPPQDKQPRWIEGYSVGLNIVRERLRQNAATQTANAIEQILMQPIDALVQNQRR